MTKIKSFSVFIFITILGLFALRALFHSGFYTSHDGWHIVARLYHFDKAVRDLQIPPRWSSDLLHGFGYPLFIFSYHLPWIIAEPFVLFGASVFDAIKAVFILTYIGSGLIFYGWIKDMWGKLSGAVGAFVYLFCSYRFATILVRANMGEAVNFMFMPMVFWGLYRIHKRRDLFGTLLVILGVSGSILSHAMVVYLFALPIFIYFIALLFNSQFKKQFVFQTVISMLLGFTIDAYYLIPATFYKSLTSFTIYKGLYKDYFTPFSKLLYSPWGYNAVGLNDEMSRQIGIGVWVSVSLAVIFLTIHVLKNWQNFRLILRSLLVPLSLVFSFFCAILLMQKISLPIWAALENYSVIDFPFRFLSVTTLVGAALSGYAIKIANRKFKMLSLVLLIFVVSYTNRNYMKVNLYTDVPLALYVASEVTTNTDDEYLPKWVDRSSVKQENLPPLIGDGIHIIDSTQKTNEIMVNYTSSSDQILNVRQLYFPGMSAQIDNIDVPIENSNNGTIRLNTKSGTHNFHLKYIPTPIMRVGEAISSISILVVIIYSVYLKSIEKKRTV